MTDLPAWLGNFLDQTLATLTEGLHETGDLQPGQRLVWGTNTPPPLPGPASVARVTCEHPDCPWWVETTSDAQSRALLAQHTRDAHRPPPDPDCPACRSQNRGWPCEAHFRANTERPTP